MTRKWLTIFAPLKSQAETVNNRSLFIIEGGGFVEMPIAGDGDIINPTLKEVVYAPNAYCNLLS